MKATESKPNKNFFSGVENVLYGLIITFSVYITTKLLTAILHALGNPIAKSDVKVDVGMLGVSIFALVLFNRYSKKK